MPTETPKAKRELEITPVDLKLVQPILAAKIAAADDKAKRTFTRSPSILAAAVANEAQEKGIVSDRAAWRGIYYPLRDSVVPQLFPRAAKAA